VAIIGNNDVSTAGFVTSTSWEHTINSTDSLVCPAGQTLTEFNFRSARTAGGAGETIELGIYDITSGADGAPLVTTTTLTFDGSAAGVYSSTGLNVDLSAYSGQTLAIAFAKPTTIGAQGHRISLTEPQSSAADTSLDDPFVLNVSNGPRFYGIWAVTSTGASLAIDTEPTTIRATESFDVVVSNPATAPTTGNTTGNLNGLTGIAPTSVSGSDPYTISFTLPRTTAKLFSDTGYTFDIDIDAESVSTSVIPYLPATGWDYILLDRPDANSPLTSSYSGTEPDTGDQAVWETSTSPDGATVTIFEDLAYSLSPNEPAAQTSGFYVLTGTETAAGPLDSLDWEALSTGGGMVSPIVSSIVSNIVTDMVS